MASKIQLSMSETTGDSSWTTTTHDGNYKEKTCCFNLRQKLSRAFYSPKGFLFFISLYIFFQSLVASGYTAAVATSIEQRYSLRTTEIGTIVSSVDIGSLSVVVLVAWLGGKGNRAQWVGAGGILVAVGSALFTLPQWISDPYAPSGTDINNLENDVCSNQTMDLDCTGRSNDTSNVYMTIFIIASILIGMGSSPIYTLGTTYVDDSATRDAAPVFVSVIYLIGALGPAAGYILGGVVLKTWVDVEEEARVDPNDSRWVGRWWVGFLIATGAIVITSIPLFFYKATPPRDLIVAEAVDGDSELNEELINNSTASSQMSFGSSIWELPSLLMSMLKNHVFIIVTLIMCCEFSIVVAFMTFMPKYIQDQFSMDPSKAAILCGGILLPAAGVGIMIGGFLIRKFDLKTMGCSKLAAIASGASFLLFIPAFFIKCGNAPIAGVTVDYPLQPNSITPPGSLPTADCNVNCHCDQVYQPVCDFTHGITYQNPCLAGCNTVNGDNATFSNCSCVGAGNASESTMIEIGACPINCNNSLIPYLALVFLITMITCCAQTPAIFITLRSVKEDERPIAMGMQYLLLRLLAYIPTPIYIGRAIDSACIILDGSVDTCDEGGGACAVYSPSKFRHIYFGIAASIKILSFCGNLYLLRILYTKAHRNSNAART